MLERLNPKAASALTFGVRPQHFSLVGAGEDNALEGRVSHVEFMGHEVYLYVNVEGQQMIVVVSATAYDRSKIQGDVVRLQPSQETAHLFDRKTGENVSLADLH